MNCLSGKTNYRTGWSSSPLGVIALVTVLLSPALVRIARAQPGSGQEVVYTCPMDPDVSSKEPGTCPRCGMSLRAASPKNRAGSTTAGVVRSAEGEALVGGLKIPDTKVLDQDGRKLHFYSDVVKGKTVAINFIFTTCTTICPPLTATFRRVQQTLGDRIGRDITLVSISVDPGVDTPERMKSFASKFHAGPGWIFITGDQGDVDQLLASLGASVPNKNDHTPTVLVGNDPAGYWTRGYGLAPATTLADLISATADKRPRDAALR